MSTEASAPELEAVLFDAGMTLLLPRAPVATTYHAEARALGIPIDLEAFRDRFQAVWQSHRAAPADDLSTDDLRERERWRSLTQELAAGFPLLAARHAAWHERLVHHYDDPRSWVLAEGTERLLHELKGRGLRLAIVSNWHLALHGLLAAMGLADAFDLVLTSADVGFRKPHPAPFLEAIHRLRVAKEATVHVGDSLAEDVRGAQAAGLRSVLIDPSSKTEELTTTIRSLPALLEALDRLPAAQSAREALSSPVVSKIPRPPPLSRTMPRSLAATRNLSLVNVAEGMGRLGHELRNALTVLYGLVDDLSVGDREDPIHHREVLAQLETGIARTNDTTNALFALRAQVLLDESVVPSIVAEELAPLLHGADSLLQECRSLPELMGNPRDFEGLVFKLAAVAAQAGGIASSSQELRARYGVDGPTLLWRINLRQAPDDGLARVLSAAVLALGGRCHCEGATIVVELLVRAQNGPRSESSETP